MYKKYFKNTESIVTCPVCFLLEDILQPEKYVNIIKDYFIRIKKYILNRDEDAKFLCGYLTRQFKKYGITFILDSEAKPDESDYYNYGIARGDYTGEKKKDIVITCNQNIIGIQRNTKNFDTFLKHVLIIIGHELVHRLQALNINDLKLRKIIYANPYNENNIIEYLSNKYEIMIRAWQIIEELRFWGLKDNDIKMKIKTRYTASMSLSLTQYRIIFNNDSPVIKLLYKYMYMYLENED